MPEEKKLSVEEWHAMAQAGTMLPLRIPVNGDSMYPLIRRNRDLVTIVPVTQPCGVGDIVMFADPARKRYVLHRLWKIDGDRVLTWGDHCYHTDGWMPAVQLWGIAVLIERDGRTLKPDPVRGMRHARCRHLYMNTVGRIKRLLRRCIGGGGREE